MHRLCLFGVRASLLCIAATISWLFIPLPSLFSFHLISSRRSFSWKLFIASHCRRSLCHPIPSHLISSHVFSAFFHLISYHPISCLLSLSQLFSPDHNCSHLFSCHLKVSHLFSVHLNSSLLNPSQLLHSTQLALTQLFSALHQSSPVRSSQLIPSHLISAYPSFSQMFTVLLCTTKLAQSTSQYYFVLQSLHKVLPSTTLYYSTRLAQSTLHTEAFTQRSVYTQQAFTQRSLYTEELLHTASFHTESLYTEKPLHWEAFTQQSFCTEELLHTEAVTHNGTRICSSKIGARRQSQKRTILKYFKKNEQNERHQRETEKQLLTNHQRNRDAATPTRSTMPSCKRPYYHARSRMQPLHGDLQRLSCKAP